MLEIWEQKARTQLCWKQHRGFFKGLHLQNWCSCDLWDLAAIYWVQLKVSYVFLKGFSNTEFWSSVLFLPLHCITTEALENRMPWEGEAVTCKMTIDGTWWPVEAPNPLGDFLSLVRLQPQISYPGPLESKCCSPHLITKSHSHAADVGKAKGVYLCAWRLVFS